MNRYRSGGPSKASATTQCQKCLQRGHYSYECNSKQQDRPYQSRPSRTQQLANPKLAPKITEAAPPKPGAQKQKDERKDVVGLKRKHEGPSNSPRKRSRSVSSYSSDSDSVSTISTNASRSRSRSPSKNKGYAEPTRPSRSGDSRRNQSPGRPRHQSRSRSRSRSPSPARSRRGARGDHRSRSPARSLEHRSRRRSRSRSHSPYRDVEKPMSPAASRERSLSPYSRRIALTRGTQSGS